MTVDKKGDLVRMMDAFLPDNLPTLASVRQAAENNKGRASSSCLLRVAPIAIWGHRLSDKEFETAIREEVSLTHTDDLSIQASICYGLFIKYLLNSNGDRNDSLEIVHQFATLNDYRDILKLIELALKSKGTQVTDCLDDPDALKHSFVWAIYFVNQSYDFKTAMRKARSES